MDAISLIMALFLNLNEPCTALPASIIALEGQDYQVLHYWCGDKTFRIWQRHCTIGSYWGRPFLLEESTTGHGVYVNRFGEVQSGWHVSMNDTYFPLCGS